MIICVCRFKGKPPQFPCQHHGVLEDNSVSVYKTSVVANSADKIYNKHAKVLQPPPMSSCSMLVSLDIFSRTEDAAVTLEDPNRLNNCSEQVFLLFLSNAELSNDELPQSILAVFLSFFIYI